MEDVETWLLSQNKKKKSRLIRRDMEMEEMESKRGNLWEIQREIMAQKARRKVR